MKLRIKISVRIKKKIITLSDFFSSPFVCLCIAFIVAHTGVNKSYKMTKGEEDLREVESGVLESVLRPYFEHKKKLSHKCVISSFKWMPFEWGPHIENERSTNMTKGIQL